LPEPRALLSHGGRPLPQGRERVAAGQANKRAQEAKRAAVAAQESAAGALPEANAIGREHAT
jgi:hypothetical protein